METGNKSSAWVVGGGPPEGVSGGYEHPSRTGEKASICRTVVEYRGRTCFMLPRGQTQNPLGGKLT